MAFGFPASYSTTVERAGSRQPSRDAIGYAFDVLGWNYDVVDVDLFRATVPASGASWGEHFTVSLETPGLVEIKSSCLFIQVFNWGANKRKVKRFLTHFSQKEIRELRSGPNEPTYFDESGQTPVRRLLNDK